MSNVWGGLNSDEAITTARLQLRIAGAARTNKPMRVLRKYRTEKSLVNALSNGSFCVEGFGPAKIERLKAEFL